MSIEDEKHVCGECGEEFESLVTRQGFVQTYFIEWVCSSCFEKLEGVSFDEFSLKEVSGE